MAQGILNRLPYLRGKQRQRTIDGSPVFPASNTAIVAAGAMWGIDFEQTNRYKKYLPFDCFELVNESDNPLDLVINDGEALRVPAYGTKGLADIAVWRFHIVNQGGDNIPIGELSINAFRSAEAEMVKRGVIFGTEFER